MNPEDTNYFAIEYTVTPYTIDRAGTRWQEIVPEEPEYYATEEEARKAFKEEAERLRGYFHTEAGSRPGGYRAMEGAGYGVELRPVTYDTEEDYENADASRYCDYFDPIDIAEYTYSDYEEEERRRHYEEGREAAREEASDWQSNEATKPMSMDELADWQDYFYDLGSRYGLLEEFQEAGVC